MGRTIYANQAAFNILYKLKGKQLADEDYLLKESRRFLKIIHSRCKIPVFIELRYDILLESLRSYAYFDMPEKDKYAIKDWYKDENMFKTINSSFDKDIQKAIDAYIGPFIKLNKLKKKK